VVWRAGLDPNPLDVTDPADFTWLEALIWPGRRRTRHGRTAPLVRGDLVDDLPALAAQAPAGATLVVFHTSVLYQVPSPRREASATMVRALPGHWIANEGPDVLTYDPLPAPPDGALRKCTCAGGDTARLDQRARAVDDLVRVIPNPPLVFPRFPLLAAGPR
jgi:hypothetical protein